MKAIIVDEPGIGRLLRGEKTWEMRNKNCKYQGEIGLIRKGSGHVVGVADMIGSLPALDSLIAYADAERNHGISPERQQKAFADGRRIPWVLANVRRLSKPVPYIHKNGAVIWVNLEPAEVAAIKAQL